LKKKTRNTESADVIKERLTWGLVPWVAISWADAEAGAAVRVGFCLTTGCGGWGWGWAYMPCWSSSMGDMDRWW
jgi:hypothetical protein